MTDSQLSRSMNSRLDEVMSLLTRERADWVCECCDKDYKQDKGNLHWSHYIGRSEFHTRWHPVNANAHCIDCHRYFTDNPDAHHDWFIKKMSIAIEEYLQAYLQERRDNMLKWAQQQKIEMHLFYRQQLSLMLKNREIGFTGWMNYSMFHLH